MKKTLLYIFIVTLSMVIAGCSKGQTENKETELESIVSDSEISETGDETSSQETETETGETSAYDEIFLNNFSEALQIRWEANETDNDEESRDMTFQEYVQDLKRSVDAEKEVLNVNDVRSQIFKDSLLQEYAIAYVNGLDKQEQLIDTAIKGEIAEDDFYKEWETSFMKRFKQICAIYDNYDIKIDSKYMFQLNTIHNTVYIDEYGEERFWNILNGDAFWDNLEVTEDEDGKDLITSIIKNQTEYEFKELPIYFCINDSKGTEDYDDDEELESIEYIIGDWKPGEDVIITFKRTTDSTENEEVYLTW